MNNLLSQSKLFWKKNGSSILTYVGVAGVATTAILAAKATPKAMRLLDKAKEEKGEELTTLEKVKIAGPSYIPTIIVGVSTISCIVGVNTMSKRSQAALLSAYTLIDGSYKEYKDKVKELYGEETHNEIVNSIMVEKAEEDWYVTGSYFADSCNLESEENDGEPKLFYDIHSSRYFEATIERVITAEYHLNRNYTLRGMVYLNEFYEFIGIETTDYGSVMGWAPTDDGEYWIEFNHKKAVMDDGLEVYIIEMPFEPTYEPWDY